MRAGTLFAALALIVDLGGCSGSPTGPTGVTINGIVRDRSGEPISGATVLVSGKQPVMTSQDGRFSLSGIGTPYDLAVFVSSQNTGTVYMGLTRLDPSVIGAVNPTGAEHDATIEGTVPTAPGKVTTVFFISGSEGAVGATDQTTGAYTIAVKWHSATTTYSGLLAVLQWTSSPPTYTNAGLPLSYDGYASKPVTITAGGTVAGADFAAAELTDPPEQTVAGTVALPAGYTLNRRDLILSFGNIPTLGWAEVSDPNVHPLGAIPLTFTYTVPVLSGVTFGVDAVAPDPFGASSYIFKPDIAGNATGVVVPLESAPHLSSPADGAAAIDVTTPFSWSQGGGVGVNVLAAIPDNASNPTFFVFTTAAAATVPDFTRAGVVLPPGASYHWHIDRIFPLASVDEAAGDGYLRLVDGEAGDVGETVSESFGFTFKTGARLAPQVGSTPILSRSCRGAWVCAGTPSWACAPCATAPSAVAWPAPRGSAPVP